jgi:sucrose-6-phosphatase
MPASIPLKLFVTDLDYTLVGDDVALAEIDRLLTGYRDEFGTKIVYATGRSRASYQQLAIDRNLPTPDALIVAVGTEIYHEDTAIDPDLAWSDRLSVNWDRETIVSICAQFADLIPQPEAEQRPYKVSYYLSPSVATNVLIELQKIFIENSLNVDPIYSGNRDLDILPKGGNKGGAVQFLKSQWQIDDSYSIVCGDSGNDISLFSYGKSFGIMVGNAGPELRSWSQNHSNDLHYLAAAKYGAGILEGLRYFGFC